MDQTALILVNNSGHNVSDLRELAPHSLVALANLYYHTQVVGRSEATADAKRRDLNRFLNFYHRLFHHDEPSQWHATVTRAFIKHLFDDPEPPLSQASVARIYASVRHFARWAHQNAFAFPFGCPTDGVQPPTEPEGDWYGLTRTNELRLLSAARALQTQTGRRGINQGVRDYAIICVLLRSGLRISELLGVDLAQWNGRGFTHVRLKGNYERPFVPVRGDTRKALEQWIEQRGKADGPMFTTRRGHRLGRKQFYDVLKRVERLANVHLPAEEQFEVTPHVLRHTFLRRLAEIKGVHYAKEASGHKTDRYIWRYVKPSSQDLAEAIDALDDG